MSASPPRGLGELGVQMVVRRVLVAIALIVPLGLAACGNDEPDEAVAGPATAAAASSAPPPEPFVFEVGPAAGTKNLPITAEVETRVSGGKVTTVTLVDDKGKNIGGELRADGTTWVPGQPLEYNRTYTASVTATATNGTPETKTTNFATMAKPGGGKVGSGLYLF